MGAEALARREFDRAVLYLRAGLGRSPLNARARVQLAQLYVASRRPDLAKKLLLERIDQLSADTDFLHHTLLFLTEFHHDEELTTLAERLLPAATGPRRTIVALHAAAAAFHRGNYDRAEQLLTDERLEQTPDGALLLARIDAERDFPELALLRLTGLVNDGSAGDAAYVEIAQIQRQLGHAHKLGTTATLHLASDPLSPSPRITLLYLHHERGDTTSLANEVDSFLTFFRDHEPGLLALADFAANTGRPAIAARVEEICRARGSPLQAVALMHAEASIAAGQYANGLALVQTYLRENPGWTENLGAVFDSLQAIALFGLNRSDEARLHLDHLLARPALRAENLRLVANRLVALGHVSHARTVLTRAVTLDALNQAALTLLVRIEAENGHVDTLPANTRRLLCMRKPSRDTLALVLRQFGRDVHMLHPEQGALLNELQAHLAGAPAFASRL